MAVHAAREAGRTVSLAGLQATATSVAPVALIVAFGILLSGRVPESLFLALAAAIGLPHGAFDYAVGRRAFAAHHGASWWRPFLGGYLALASATLLLWWAAPGLALPLFLVLSLLHFGDGDAAVGPAARAMRIVAHGGAVVVVPAACHPAEVERLFAVLTPAHAASVAALLGGPVAALWTASALGTLAVHAARGRAEDGAASVNLALVALLFALATPLVAFAVYFAAIHTPRALAASLPVRRTRAGGMPLAILLSLLGLALGVCIFMAGAGVDIGAGIVRATFLTLSALTVPHMWLEWRAARSAAAPANGA